MDLSWANELPAPFFIWLVTIKPTITSDIAGDYLFNNTFKTDIHTVVPPLKTRCD